MKDLIRDLGDMVLGEFCDKPWGVDFVKFQISFDRKGRVEDITHTTIPQEHSEALLDRVREVAKPHGKRLRGMLCTVIVGFRSPSRNLGEKGYTRRRIDGDSGITSDIMSAMNETPLRTSLLSEALRRL